MRDVRIFYRSREAVDTCIMGWSFNLSETPIMFREMALTDPLNQNIAYEDISLEDSDLNFQSVNEHGITTKKIVEGQIVDREQSDINKSPGNKIHLTEDAETSIQGYLQGRLKETWLMFGVKHAFQYLQSLQAALNIVDGDLDAAGQASKGMLVYLKTYIGDPIEQIMSDRDAAIVALDTED